MASWLPAVQQQLLSQGHIGRAAKTLDLAGIFTRITFKTKNSTESHCNTHPPRRSSDDVGCFRARASVPPLTLVKETALPKNGYQNSMMFANLHAHTCEGSPSFSVPLAIASFASTSSVATMAITSPTTPCVITGGHIPREHQSTCASTGPSAARSVTTVL